MAAAKRKKRRPRTRLPVSAPAVDGSSLCLQCGMCCDGTLFGDARLLENEVELAASLGLEQERVDDGLRFRLPCSLFLDGCCSIYDQQKPAVCESYRCELLVAYGDGRSARDECLDVIGAMQGVVRRLEEEMGLRAGEFTFAHLVSYLLMVRPHDTPEAHARFMMVASHYLDLGRRYFRFPDKDIAKIVADTEAALPV